MGTRRIEWLGARLHALTLLQRFVLLGAIIALGIAVPTAYVIREHARSLEESIMRERLQVANMAANSINIAIEHGYVDLMDMAVLVRDALRTPETSSPGALRDLIAAGIASDSNTLFTEGVAALRPDGSVIVAAGLPGRPAPDVAAALPHIQRALSGTETFVSPGYRVFSGGSRTAVAIVVPVMGPSGPPSVYLVGLVSLGDTILGELLHASVAIGNTGHADLVDATGHVLLSTESSATLTAGDHPTFYAEMLAGAGPTIRPVPHVEETGYAPEEDHVMAWVSMERAPWFLALGGAVSETFAPVRRFEQRIMALTGIVFTLALAGAFIGAVKLVRPVRVLSDATRRMAAGNLEAPIVIQEGGEIGDLAEAMEAMRTSLRASLQEIGDLNRNLEQRIAERTEEVAQQNRELVAASAIAETMTSFVHVQDLLEHATRTVAEATGQESLAIFLVDRDGRRLTLAAGRGLRPPFSTHETRVRIGDCLCGQVALYGEPSVVDDVRSDPVVTRPACALAGFHCIASVPLWSRERVEGVLTLFSTQPGSLSQADFRAVNLIGRQIGIAIQNARLYEDLEEKERQARRLVEMTINAQEEERKRVARELHDETGQALIAIQLSLEGLEASLPPEWETARTRLRALHETTQHSLAELRKMVMDLRPSALDDLGLVPAVRRYALQHLEPLGVTVHIEAKDMEGLSKNPSVETLLFRVVQEAINNVARHSHASRVEIRFWREPGELRASVRDDGVGFDPAALPPPGHGTGSTGLGLMGMRERASLVGGDVTVTSAPGRGTAITVCVPAESIGGP